MQKKILSSIFLAFLLICQIAYAHTATIEHSGNHRYKAVRLTPEIYNQSKENLADLILLDQEGGQLPYFINSYSKSGADVQASYPMKRINSFVKDEYFYYDYALTQQPDSDILATSIEVTTKTNNFAKQVELFGGYDNKNWEKVKDDTLYRVEDSTKLAISFSGPRKYTHYRFRLSNNLEKLSFDNVTLQYSDTINKQEYFLQSITPQYRVEQQASTTIIHVSGVKNLQISSIALQTDSMFKRTATFAGGKSKQIYNLSFGETIYQDTMLPFEGYKTGEDTLQINIQNKDDKPIDLKGITLTYFSQELIFEGKNGGDYKLQFGESGKTIPPSYDIVNYKELILKEGYDLLQIKEVLMEEVQPEKQPVDYTLLFNVVVVVIAILLGVTILLKLKKK